MSANIYMWYVRDCWNCNKIFESRFLQFSEAQACKNSVACPRCGGKFLLRRVGSIVYDGSVAVIEEKHE
jgi:DNA-directed RNA polymerase subunit RPC12/RpoP